MCSVLGSDFRIDILVFIELIRKMGYVGYFYVESKSFELRVGDGNQNIKVIEWGRMNLSTMYMGETRLVWLVKMMNVGVRNDGNWGMQRSSGGWFSYVPAKKDE
jgi:hypothetical protein